jgi:hypothetical protein
MYKLVHTRLTACHDTSILIVERVLPVTQSLQVDREVLQVSVVSYTNRSASQVRVTSTRKCSRCLNLCAMSAVCICARCSALTPFFTSSICKIDKKLSRTSDGRSRKMSKH